MKIRVFTHYVGAGTDDPWDPRRPSSFDLGIKDMTDVTGRAAPAIGDRLVIEAEVNAAQIAVLQADAGHGPDSVLWTDANKDQVIDSTSHANLRTLLAARGLTVNEINRAVGTTPAGRTRAEITDSLIQVLKTR